MDQIKIGAFLRELRKEHDLSQEQLADRFNVSSRSVSRWENGRTLPDFDLLIELADHYGVSIDEIMDGKRKEEQTMKKFIIIGSAVVTAVTAAVIIIVKRRK